MSEMTLLSASDLTQSSDDPSDVSNGVGDVPEECGMESNINPSIMKSANTVESEDFIIQSHNTEHSPEDLKPESLVNSAKTRTESETDALSTDKSDSPGFVFWREQLRGARLVVAPMVDASELAWRMLSRRYGAELCYTPMLHSAVLVRDPRYRRDNLQSCAQDRPLIVQLCGNDASVVGAACGMVAPHCDAIDINLGCPQAIARKGRYGAFLMEDWGLIESLVRSAVAASTVPITCKIRVYPDAAKTVQYALMLERSGASLLTVHGRTRDQKGPRTGLADWSYVTAVRKAVNIPVFANGNIRCMDDVERCLQETGAQGVMSAETNLHNPAFFVGPAHFPGSAPTVWQMALEYLELALQYPCPISYTRGHIFKLLQHCFTMPSNSDVRQVISRSNTVAEMAAAVEVLRDRMLPYATGGREWRPDTPELASLPLPPWLCQPYVRIPPDVHAKRCEEGQIRAMEERLQQLQEGLFVLPGGAGDAEIGVGGAESGVGGAESGAIHQKRHFDDKDGHEKEADLLLKTNEMGHLSKKKAKKLLRNPRKKFPGPAVKNLNLCICRSPRGGKCVYHLCKACCKSRCYLENLDCTGHKIWVKTNRRKAATLPPKEITSSLEMQAVLLADDSVNSISPPHTQSSLLEDLINDNNSRTEVQGPLLSMSIVSESCPDSFLLSLENIPIIHKYITPDSSKLKTESVDVINSAEESTQYTLSKSVTRPEYDAIHAADSNEI